ncbi:MAG: glycosyltransferase family 2 protein, partial [Deltaproteobacteria bacterium]|nr:glycosyltransferase family 2 protein [Deltaproteobacteria bacterium]
TFNNARTIEATLASVRAQVGVETRVIAVDNASYDGTRGVLGSTSGLRFIEQYANTGFAAGMNRALREADRPYVLLLNPNVVLPPDTLRALVEALENAPEDVAAVQPKLLRGGEPPTLDSTGVVLNLGGMSPYDRGQGEEDRGQYDGDADVFGPTAACALWRREALFDLAVDGEIFDEGYFAYYEDVDLAWRARSAGNRFLYVPQAHATHDRTNPAGHGPLIEGRAMVNRYRLVAKCARPILAAFLWAKCMPLDAARALWHGFRHPSYFWGIFQGKMAIWGVCRKRRATNARIAEILRHRQLKSGDI